MKKKIITTIALILTMILIFGGVTSVYAYDSTLHENNREYNDVSSSNYSTTKYLAISVYLDDKYIGFMGFKGGLNYYEENGYYVYLANPTRYNIDPIGKTPTLALINNAHDEIETVYKYSSVKL